MIDKFRNQHYNRSTEGDTCIQKDLRENNTEMIRRKEKHRVIIILHKQLTGIRMR